MKTKYGRGVHKARHGEGWMKRYRMDTAIGVKISCDRVQVEKHDKW